MNPIRQTRARHPIRAGAAIIAALCVLTVGCSMIVATPSSHPLAVTDSDNGKRFTLSPGDHLEVSLSAIPGTGYIWEITDNDSSVLKPRGLSDFELPKMAGAGSMGAQVFHFDAGAPGAAKLAMAYRRPWEATSAPARAWSITVTVRQ
ncbi:MAG TPA: protease inhibitor I42 family protein [Candidatus Binataceae bacterium]|nr:protease inhibitor I42 family protein [Candidatus Binataceae bacterium]